MIKYLLIMQIITKGGVSVNTVELDTLKQCETVRQTFLTSLDDSRYWPNVYRKAKCVELAP